MDAENYEKILLKKIFESAADGILTVGEDNMIHSMNPAAATIFGYDRKELLGQSLDILIPVEHRNGHRNQMGTFVAVGQARIMGSGRVVNGLHKDGHLIPVEVGISRVDMNDGVMMIAMLRDVTERRETEEALTKLANYDQLTGLANRKYFEELLERTVVRAKRYKRRFAVLFLDLNKFKPVNDELGHEAGDILLIQVGQRLQKVLRESDTVARYGGDEFVVILEEAKNKTDCRVVAQKIASEFKVAFHLGEHTATVGISIGIALFPDHGEDGDALLIKSDKAMYKAKTDNKKRYTFAV